MRKFKLKSVLTLLLLPCFMLNNGYSLNIKTTQKNIDVINDHTEEINRLFDDNVIGLDFKYSGATLDDELSTNNLMTNFFDDGSTLTLDEIYDFKDYALSLAKEFDPTAHYYVPKSFDTSSANNYVTTPQNFINVFKDSNISTIEQKSDVLRRIFISQTTTQDSKTEINDSEFKPTHDVKILNIFVPGVGGDASHWTNDGNEKENIYIRSNSLPERVARLYNSEIYVYRQQNSNDEEKPLIYISKSQYNTSLKEADYETKSLRNLLDYSSILYEDTNNNCKSQNDFLVPFEKFMNNLILLYPDAKFNLFGHSRGGDINLEFATKYLDKINKIFSLGTPYYSPVLANAEQCISKFNEKDGIFYLIKLASKQISENNDAFRDLTNEELMRNLRKNWNALSNKPALTTYGYNFTLSFCTFIYLLNRTIRIDFPVAINWDVLVGTNNAKGLADKGIKVRTFRNNFTLFGASDTSEELEVTKRETITIPDRYIISVKNENKKYLCSSINQVPVPHNLETMYYKSVESIMEELENEKNI